jgi:hypothetical protein
VTGDELAIWQGLTQHCPVFGLCVGGEWVEDTQGKTHVVVSPSTVSQMSLSHFLKLCGGNSPEFKDCALV